MRQSSGLTVMLVYSVSSAIPRFLLRPFCKITILDVIFTCSKTYFRLVHSQVFKLLYGQGFLY